ncbi:MAG: hypothetical protein FWD89_00785 [Firmicutes bacterium]|nr:hypothetical protein [Bacillota bacterium]
MKLVGRISVAVVFILALIASSPWLGAFFTVRTVTNHAQGFAPTNITAFQIMNIDVPREAEIGDVIEIPYAHIVGPNGTVNSINTEETLVMGSDDIYTRVNFPKTFTSNIALTGDTVSQTGYALRPIITDSFGAIVRHVSEIPAHQREGRTLLGRPLNVAYWFSTLEDTWYEDALDNDTIKVETDESNGDFINFVPATRGTNAYVVFFEYREHSRTLGTVAPLSTPAIRTLARSENFSISVYAEQFGFTWDTNVRYHSFSKDAEDEFTVRTDAVLAFMPSEINNTTAFTIPMPRVTNSRGHTLYLDVKDQFGNGANSQLTVEAFHGVITEQELLEGRTRFSRPIWVYDNAPDTYALLENEPSDTTDWTLNQTNRTIVFVEEVSGGTFIDISVNNFAYQHASEVTLRNSGNQTVFRGDPTSTDRIETVPVTAGQTLLPALSVDEVIAGFTVQRTSTFDRDPHAPNVNPEELTTLKDRHGREVKTFRITMRNQNTTSHDFGRFTLAYRFIGSQDHNQSNANFSNEIQVRNAANFNPVPTPGGAHNADLVDLTFTFDSSEPPRTATLGNELKFSTVTARNAARNDVVVQAFTRVTITWVDPIARTEHSLDNEGNIVALVTNASQRMDISDTMAYTFRREGAYRVRYQVIDVYGIASREFTYTISNVRDDLSPTIMLAVDYTDDLGRNIQPDSKVEDKDRIQCGRHLLPTRVASISQTGIPGITGTARGVVYIPAVFAHDNWDDIGRLDIRRTIRARDGGAVWTVETRWADQNNHRVLHVNQGGFIYFAAEGTYVLEISARDRTTQGFTSTSFEFVIGEATNTTDVPTEGTTARPSVTFVRGQDVNFVRPSFTHAVDNRMLTETFYYFGDIECPVNETADLINPRFFTSSIYNNMDVGDRPVDIFDVDAVIAEVGAPARNTWIYNSFSDLLRNVRNEGAGTAAEGNYLQIMTAISMINEAYRAAGEPTVIRTPETREGNETHYFIRTERGMRENINIFAVATSHSGRLMSGLIGGELPLHLQPGIPPEVPPLFEPNWTAHTAAFWNMEIRNILAERAAFELPPVFLAGGVNTDLDGTGMKTGWDTDYYDNLTYTSRDGWFVMPGAAGADTRPTEFINQHGVENGGTIAAVPGRVNEIVNAHQNFNIHLPAAVFASVDPGFNINITARYLRDTGNGAFTATLSNEHTGGRIIGGGTSAVPALANNDHNYRRAGDATFRPSFGNTSYLISYNATDNNGNGTMISIVFSTVPTEAPSLRYEMPQGIDALEIGTRITFPEATATQNGLDITQNGGTVKLVPVNGANWGRAVFDATTREFRPLSTGTFVFQWVAEDAYGIESKSRQIVVNVVHRHAPLVIVERELGGRPFWNANNQNTVQILPIEEDKDPSTTNPRWQHIEIPRFRVDPAQDIEAWGSYTLNLTITSNNNAVPAFIYTGTQGLDTGYINFQGTEALPGGQVRGSMIPLTVANIRDEDRPNPRFAFLPTEGDGEYVVTYIATSGGNSTVNDPAQSQELTFRLHVGDTIDPVITVPEVKGRHIPNDVYSVGDRLRLFRFYSASSQITATDLGGSRGENMFRIGFGGKDTGSGYHQDPGHDDHKDRFTFDATQVRAEIRTPDGFVHTMETGAEFEWFLVQSGTHTLTYRVMDLAGNTGDTGMRVFTFRVDAKEAEENDWRQFWQIFGICAGIVALAGALWFAFADNSKRFGKRRKKDGEGDDEGTDEDEGDDADGTKPAKTSKVKEKKKPKSDIVV